MNENEKQPSDQELDDLLRQVNVPSELKSNLRTIPQTSGLAAPPTSSTSNAASHGRMAIMLVLAATVMGIVAFLVWPLLQSSDDPIVSKDAPTIDKTASEDAPPTSEFTVPEIQLVNLVELSEQTIAQLEIERLESRLHDLQATHQKQLGQHEYASIVLAMADQSVVNLGGSRETANGSMVSIIEKFPNTRGAQLAQQFLDQQAN